MYTPPRKVLGVKPLHTICCEAQPLLGMPGIPAIGIICPAASRISQHWLSSLLRLKGRLCEPAEQVLPNLIGGTEFM